VLVLETDDEHVGGLARTMTWKGHRYDVGPHRFYTKSDAVTAMWQEMLPEPFLEITRLTRIYYERRFYPYPLELGVTLRNFGVLRAGQAALSWMAARARPRRPERSFEDWVVNRFGNRLYRAFFRTYTEKVWGVPCAEINKDWAAQRIRGLSMSALLRGALGLNGQARVKSLVDRFHYPRHGAGQLWEAVAREVEARGGRVLRGRRVVRLAHDGGRVREAVTDAGERHAGEHFVVTMTLDAFVHALDPPPPAEVLAAGAALRHRDFITVMLVAPAAGLFPDQWIYVHDPGVKVARITNYANWGGQMSDDPATTALGMEYFCDRGDALWSLPDEQLLALASAELAAIGLADLGRAPDGRVHRSLDTYPVYDDAYRRHRETLKRWIGSSFCNVQPAGRKGLHNYNSQDHAMMTATLAVRNQVEGTHFDAWSVNTEQEYAEEGEAPAAIEERLVPRRLGGPDAGAGRGP
jgi:protoporphyrinogen oxidase